MKKENVIIVNSPYRFYDVSWTHKWNYNNPDEPGTVKLNVFKDSSDSGWWWFDSDADNVKKKSNIFFKYDSANITPETKFLGPSNIKDVNHINFTNSIEKIVIDRTPPQFISDVGTQYTIFSTHRHFSFIFNDNNGIDPNNIQIQIGNATVINISHKGDPEFDFGFSPDSFSLSKSGNDYKLEFDLDENDIWNADSLNANGLSLIVYDYASNKTIYKIEKEFKTYTDKDLLDLEPLIIEFDKHVILLNEKNVNQVIHVKITNPNKDFIDIPIFPHLMENDNYVGHIDPSSIHQENGVMNLTIEVNYPGLVTLEAWLDIYDQTDSITADTMKNVTYAKESCAIKLMNGKQRLIHFGPNRPNNIKNEPFGAFVMFAEEFLNSMYTSLSDKTNIGILEKIARINDFNDVQKLEKDYMMHFASQYGFEPKINLTSVENFANATQIAFGSSEDKSTSVNKMSRMREIVNKENPEEKKNSVKIVDKSQKYSDFMDEKVETILKAAFNQIPYFNARKGSRQGVYMALRLFGLNCKLINLHIKKDNPAISMNTKFYTENEITNVDDFFLTSEFDVSIFDNDLSIDEFNKSFDYYYSVITSILPINKILRKIKQVVTFKSHGSAQYNTAYSNKTIPFENVKIEFDLESGDAEIKDFIKENAAENKYCNIIKLPFYCVNEAQNYKRVMIKYFTKVKDNKITVNNLTFENLVVEKIMDNYIILRTDDDTVNFYDLCNDDITSLNISFTNCALKNVIHNV